MIRWLDKVHNNYFIGDFLEGIEKAVLFPKKQQGWVWSWQENEPRQDGGPPGQVHKTSVFQLLQSSSKRGSRRDWHPFEPVQLDGQNMKPIKMEEEAT